MSKNNRSKLRYTRDIKERMRSVYGDICPSCKRIMSFGEDEERGLYATIDHVLPLTLGVLDEEDNLQLLCNECNVEKGDKIESRVDGGPLPLPPSLIPPKPTQVPTLVTKATIARFWDNRCGLCGRLEPCLVHEKDTTHHSG